MYTGLQRGKSLASGVACSQTRTHVCSVWCGSKAHGGEVQIIGLVKMNLRNGVVIAASGVLYLRLKLSVVTTTLAEQQFRVCMCVQGSLHLLIMACSEVNDFILC